MNEEDKELREQFVRLLGFNSYDEALHDFMTSKLEQPLHKEGCTCHQDENGTWWRTYPSGEVREVMLECIEAPLFPVEPRQMKTSEIATMRKRLHEMQNMICPICQEKTSHELTTLDHQHKLFKDQPLLEGGAGLVRGVLCRNCNSFEGKIFSNHRRLGLHKKNISLGDILRNLADYLDKENLPYIHPTERPKADKMGKRRFNELNKMYCKKHPSRKPLEYPKSGKVTEKLAKLLDDYDI